MHEYSIVQALLDRVLTEARNRNATAVHHLKVSIGELSGVEPELLDAAYQMLREPTICAGADLEIVPVAALWVCPGCGNAIARGEPLQCPDCALPARLKQGQEILLERIEMEVD